MYRALVICMMLVFSVVGKPVDLPESSLSKRIINELTPTLTEEMSVNGISIGSNLFIRIFKASKELEVWVEKEGTFHLFKTYKICTYGLKGFGPKTKYADGYAPEGFYFVKPSSLNPWSSYHLSFNLGYPNAYDRYHGYTGSALMVHGSCVSIGCYAMTNKRIEEIYTLMLAAFKGDQPFIRVHIFPFKMTDANLKKYSSSNWSSFWQNLKTGYDYFESKKIPPNVEVRSGVYVFD